MQATLLKSYTLPLPIPPLSLMMSSKVYDKAIEMIERFYGCEDEDREDGELAPAVAPGATEFSFGMASNVTPNKAPLACGLEMSSPVRTLNFA